MQKKKWKTPVAVAAGVAMFIGTGTAFAVTVPAHHPAPIKNQQAISLRFFPGPYGSACGAR